MLKHGESFWRPFDIPMDALHLRTFYEKEQLVSLFEPLLTEDNEFIDMVIRLYPQVANANELIMHSGLSFSTFNRCFLRIFGVR